MSLAGWCVAALGHPFAGLGVAGATFAMLLRSFDGIDEAPALAAQIAGQGNLAVGRCSPTRSVRPWWPVTLLAAVVVPSKRLRRALLVGVARAAARRVGPEHPTHGPVSYVGLRLADDVAYSTGVWVGAVRGPHRRAPAARPHLVAQPRAATPPGAPAKAAATRPPTRRG